MTTSTQPNLIQQLTRYAAAAATCADRYAKAFYPMIKNADEKMICCVHGAEDMEHYIIAAEVLRELGVDLTGMVERPIAERGLSGAEVLETTKSWAERAVFSALFERALLIQLKGLARNDHAPAARMADAAIAREERHVAHGLGLLRKACSAAETKVQAQESVDRLWPVALAMLDTEDSRSALLDATLSELGPLGLSVPPRTGR
jgi:ring-1,2-phenylacetyl-CoA epoxidase subunit PaaA